MMDATVRTRYMIEPYRLAGAKRYAITDYGTCIFSTADPMEVRSVLSQYRSGEHNES